MVVRVDNNGKMCNARPCNGCLNMMKSIGIIKVYYSVNNNDIICENVKDMISIQVSFASKMVEKMNGRMLAINDKRKYYILLLQKYFPSTIRKHNLDNFIKYNLINIIPDCIIIYKKINRKTINEELQVTILDYMNKLIVNSIVI